MSNPEPHIHQKLINIWAADPKIKFEYRLDPKDTWEVCSGSPGWNPRYQYRVRPKPQVAKYRMAYHKENGELGFSMCLYLNADDFRRHNVGDSFLWVQSLTETKEMCDE